MGRRALASGLRGRHSSSIRRTAYRNRTRDVHKSIPNEPEGSGRRRVVALTGASRGIGLATARALCAAGYTVVAGARDVRPLAAAGLGAQLHAVQVDLTDGAALERFAAAVGRIVDGAAQRRARSADRPTGAGGSSEGKAGAGPGGLVALINNAGVGALGAGEEFPLGRAREVMDTNLWGAARLAQLLLPLLRAGAAPERPAYLVNVGSLIAEYPVPFHAYYAASKGALRAYTLALRGELAGHGVAVVLLEPGDVATGTTPLQHAAAGSPYGAAFARVRGARTAKMAAAPRPAAVARRLLRVLGQRRPPPIVACGGSAPLLRLVRRLLPDRLAEYLTLHAYDLDGGGGSQPKRRH